MCVCVCGGDEDDDFFADDTHKSCVIVMLCDTKINNKTGFVYWVAAHFLLGRHIESGFLFVRKIIGLNDLVKHLI